MTQLRRQPSHHWNDQNETLLRQWGERSSVLRILHGTASRKYKCLSMWLTLPTIIISTIVGSVQLRFSAHDSSQNNNDFKDVELVLACCNILVACIAGVSSVLKYNEKCEAHRSVSSQFGSFYRNICCELAFPREERDPPDDLLRAMKRQYDCMLEASPDVPRRIILNFKKKYNKDNLTITLPDICNGLDPIKVCRNQSFKIHEEQEEEDPVITVGV